MALLFCDSLDGYASKDDLLSIGWTNYSASSSVQYLPTGGRFGGGCWNDNLGSGQFRVIYPVTLTSNTAVYFVAISALLSPPTGTANTIDNLLIIRSNNYSNRCLALDVSNTGEIYITNAGGVSTLIGPAGTVKPNQWHRYELKFTLGTNAFTGSAQVYVDGLPVGAALTGMSFYQASTFYVVMFQMPSARRMAGSRYDDPMVWDDTGSYCNDFLGDVRIIQMPPIADTAQADLALSAGGSGYALIDDAPSDGDTTYLSGSVGNKSEFTFGSLPSSTTAVHGVGIITSQKKLGFLSPYARAYLKSGASIINGASNAIAPGTYIRRYAGVFSADPNGPTAWTKSGFEATKLGLEIV